MAAGSRTTLLQHLRRLIGSPGPSRATDSQLLRRFLSDRDEAAFELLVWRHGPMVLNVCGRILNDEHAAEDAFQTTFLKLALKASSIAAGESVGSWLHKVAHRTALRVRQQAARREGREQPLGILPIPHPGFAPDDQAGWRELRPIIDDEVRRLPEQYRSVFILCCLQGMTNEQAALELGCPKGTVLSRLARARERLKKRLEKRGLAVGLLLPFLATWSGSRLLSVNLVASALQKVAGLMPAAAKVGGLKTPTAMLLALGTVLILTVSGAGAYFGLAGGASPPAKVPGCCGKNGTCRTTPLSIPASLGDLKK